MEETKILAENSCEPVRFLIIWFRASKDRIVCSNTTLELDLLRPIPCPGADTVPRPITVLRPNRGLGGKTQYNAHSTYN